MRIYKSKAIICVKDKYNLEYRLCQISYQLNEDGSFKYVFKPNYAIIDLTESYFFQGIPGLNLDLRKEEYVRENMTPCFISERVPPKNREGLDELLEDVGMTYLEPLIYLIRLYLKRGDIYSSDHLYLIPFVDKVDVDLDVFVGKENNISYIKRILTNITAGNRILINNEVIDDCNRKWIFKILYKIYSHSVKALEDKKIRGIQNAVSEGKYKGRKRSPIDSIKFMQYLADVNNKKITSKEAAKKMNISIDKFYREKKRLQKENDLSFNR